MERVSSNSLAFSITLLSSDGWVCVGGGGRAGCGVGLGWGGVGGG